MQSLSALAQEHRLAVFRLLVRRGPEGMPAGEIAGRVGLANATLSFHLKELANAGLVSARHEGRFIFYAANYGTMNRLLAYLTDNCCQGSAACAPARTARRTATAAADTACCAPVPRSVPVASVGRPRRSACGD